jgi:hypothetical protein
MNWEILLGIGGILIGGLFSLYFYRKSLPIREPRWAIRSNTLVQGNFSKFTDVTVRYKKQPVNTLTVSKIIFWNAGYTTIERNNIAAANPLRIQAKNGVEILDVKILSVNNSPSLLESVSAKDKKATLITFDYLDKGHGALIQVIHTGASSSDLEIVGDIKGGKAPKPIKNLSFVDQMIQSLFPGFVGLSAMIVFVLIMVFVNLYWGLNLGQDPRIAALVVVGIPFILAIVSSFWILPKLKGRFSGFPKNLGDLREFVDIDKR